MEDDELLNQYSPIFSQFSQLSQRNFAVASQLSQRLFASTAIINNVTPLGDESKQDSCNDVDVPIKVIRNLHC